MNIFVLSYNPITAARCHADQHVNKMILESAQMLSTVLGGPYRATHAKHPCTLWVGECKANARWVIDLATELNEEAKRRYVKTADHKSMEVIDWARGKLHQLPSALETTPHPLCMPDEYKLSNSAVKCYRHYYHSKELTWRYTQAPTWWAK